MSDKLFQPYQLHDILLSNRMVMAPLTRNRSNMEGLVTSIMKTYYEQRSDAGFIITESTPVSPQGIGYPMTPGIFTEAQAKSWKNVTDTVHKKRGKIFVQLQHCGRISHPDFQPEGTTPVSASAIKPEGHAHTYKGIREYVEPRALEREEISGVVSQFSQAAVMAKKAGFDGVEIHGANGYLIDQFLRDGSNQRTDVYGGSAENRMRFLNEILDSVIEIWPSEHIGVRLSPENRFNSMNDSNPQKHFEYFSEQLNERNLAYLHVLEGDMMTGVRRVDYPMLKSKFNNTYIANNGYDFSSATQALEKENADLIAFGVPFLANPDLVRRFKEGFPLNEAVQDFFYTGGEKGYTDYPFYS